MPHRGRRPTESDVAIAPIQLSFPLPNDPSVRILLHLTVLSTSIVLFLTTSSVEAPSSNCSLGSFVYAMPNLIQTSIPPLSTPLYTQTATVDFATRMAKILARKTGKPTYVGNSMNLSTAGRGGDLDEEMGGFRRVVEVVVEQVQKLDGRFFNNGT